MTKILEHKRQKKTNKVQAGLDLNRQRYGTRHGSSFLKFHSSRIFVSLPIEYSLDYFNYCKYISNVFQIFQNWFEKDPDKSKESSKKGSLDRSNKMQLLFLVRVSETSFKFIRSTVMQCYLLPQGPLTIPSVTSIRMGQSYPEHLFYFQITVSFLYGLVKLSAY